LGCIWKFRDYKVNYRFCESMLHNLGLVLKDATVSVQIQLQQQQQQHLLPCPSLTSLF